MFTAVWELDHSQSTSQKDMLKLMGRPNWQIEVIDKAKELFRFIHYRSTANVNYMHKSAHIHLDSKVLDWIHKLFRIEFNQVKYDHWITADGKPRKHADDQKRFGECESVSTWEEDKQYGPTFVIRWYLLPNRGLLTVRHSIDSKDQMLVRLKFEHRKQVAEAIKVYKRRPLSAEDEKFIDAFPKYKPHVLR